MGVTAPTSTTAPPSSPPSATVGDVTVTEGNAGTGVAVVTITLSRAVVAGETVKVNYALTAGSATAGSDYAATTGTLAFGAGEISKTVSVIVYGDTTVEPDEALSLVLSTPVGMTVADGTGLITITNDDVPPPPTLSISSVSVTEGSNSPHGDRDADPLPDFDDHRHRHGERPPDGHRDVGDRLQRLRHPHGHLRAGNARTDRDAHRGRRHHQGGQRDRAPGSLRRPGPPSPPARAR